MISTYTPSGVLPVILNPAVSQRRFVIAIEFVAVPVPLGDFRRAIRARRKRTLLQSCTATRPAASCRPFRRRPAIRAACKSRDTASARRTPSNSHSSVPRRGARTRSSRIASPGKSRRTALFSRARIESRKSFPRFRVSRILPAPESPSMCRSRCSAISSDSISLRLHPLDHHARPMRQSAVHQRLAQTFVRILELHVFPYHSDAHFAFRMLAVSPASPAISTCRAAQIANAAAAKSVRRVLPPPATSALRK